MEEGQARKVSHFRRIAHQILATTVACLGSVSLGTVLAWSAIVTPELGKSHDSFLSVPSEHEISWIASLALLGALFSGPAAGLSVPRWGPKSSMTIFSVPFVLGWKLIALSSNTWMMCIGRFITGWCGGAYTVLIPVYVSEIAENNLRSTLLSGMVTGLVTGFLFTHAYVKFPTFWDPVKNNMKVETNGKSTAVANLLYIIGKYISWMWLSIISAIFPFCLLILSPCIPESPRFLLTNNKEQLARNSLFWLRNDNDQVQLELSEIKQSVSSHQQSDNKSWKVLFKKSNMKPIMTVLILFILQQMSGINGISMFTVKIFQSADTHLNPYDATIIIGLVQLIFVLLSTVLVDRVPRKSLLIFCDLVMCAALIALGLFYYLKDNNKPLDNLLWLPLVSVVIFIMAYSVGAGPLPWIFLGDCLPASIKATGSSIITSTYWIMAFFTTKAFIWMTETIQSSGTFWTHAAFCFIAAIFTAIFVPETKGKTLAEIHTFFASNTDIFHPPIGLLENDENECENVLNNVNDKPILNRH